MRILRPTSVEVNPKGKSVIFGKNENFRPGRTMEALSKFPAVFKKDEIIEFLYAIIKKNQN